MEAFTDAGISKESHDIGTLRSLSCDARSQASLCSTKIRRFSLKKSRAFDNLSVMSTSSSESSLDLGFGGGSKSRIRTTSEPNCSEDDNEPERIGVKKTRSDTHIVMDSSIIYDFSLLGLSHGIISANRYQSDERVDSDESSVGIYFDGI